MSLIKNEENKETINDEPIEIKYEESLIDDSLEVNAIINVRHGGWQLGKKRGPQTKEVRDAKSAELIERHATVDHPMLGKHHTEEAKAKISHANKGKVHNKENFKKRALTQMMPKEKEDLVIYLYNSGIGISEILVKADINPAGLYRVLKRNNIPKRGK